MGATAVFHHPHLLLLLLLLLLLIPRPAFSCSIKNLWCVHDASGNHSVSKTTCGHHIFKCMNSTLHIQFDKEKSKWYRARINCHNKKLTVLAENLPSKYDCSFLYNFTRPVRSFELSTFVSPSFFDCKPNEYNFSNNIIERNFNSSHCGDYDLFYQRKEARADADATPAVEWTVSFHHDAFGGIQFTLLSVGFSPDGKLSPDDFSCKMSGGRCSSVNRHGSSKPDHACTCNRPCPARGIRRSKYSRNVILIGLSVGLFVSFLATGFCFCFCLRRMHRKKNINSTHSALVRSKDAEYHSNHHLTQIFTYKDLEDATDGFHSSNELGDGGFGTVYKGSLRDGRIVAVKRLYERNRKRVEQFVNEILILNQLRHPNLVTLYGCTSRQSQELLLVYEYVANGTVADHLHGSRADEKSLTWPIRMNIAVETASALAYMHCVEPQIIHRDVKTPNILLDKDFHVKVADFGLSRLFPLNVTHASTAPQGTPGYVDPEYHRCYQLTDRSDVYSFGVVLVELISSKPAVDIARDWSEINLSNMAVNKIQNGLVHELADPELGFESDPDMTRMTRSVAELALWCLQAEKDMRPSMVEVKKELAKIADGGHRVEAYVDVDKQMKDHPCFLPKSVPLSPDTVTEKWSSRFTTPNASVYRNSSN